MFDEERFNTELCESLSEGSIVSVLIATREEHGLMHTFKTNDFRYNIDTKRCERLFGKGY